MAHARDRSGMAGRVPRRHDAIPRRLLARSGRDAAGAAALIDDGVNGLIAVGSVGENTTLSPTEKREVVAVIVDAAAKRVPVLAGLARSRPSRRGRSCATLRD